MKKIALTLIIFFALNRISAAYAVEGSDSGSGNKESLEGQKEEIRQAVKETVNEGLGNVGVGIPGNQTLSPIASEPILPSFATFNAAPPNTTSMQNEKQIAKIEEKKPSLKTKAPLNPDRENNTPVVPFEEGQLPEEITPPQILPKFSGYENAYSDTKIPSPLNALILAASMVSILGGIYLVSPVFFKDLLKKLKKEEVVFRPIKLQPS